MDTPLIIQAFNGQVTKETPIWLMRQAGRYLPEYRKLREKAGSFLNLCYTPEWAAEVTLQPLRRYELDAAILFSDILVVPHAMGQGLDFKAGEGPVLGPLTIDELITDEETIHQFLSPVYETVRITRDQLDADKALIGFAGAPWTVATYMVEGRGKTGFPKILKMAQEDPEQLQCVIDRVVQVTIAYLNAQIAAGVQAVQIFDSWAGALPIDQVDRWVTQPIAKIVEGVKSKNTHIPVIGFPRELPTDLGEWADATKVQVVGLGSDVDRPKLAKILQQDRGLCVQGNLKCYFNLLGYQLFSKGSDSHRGLF